jgi:hypothetical protein
MLMRNNFAPTFAPRRGAQVGQNLPGASSNFQNLGGVGTVEALARALQACCMPCGPGGAPLSPAAVADVQQQMNQPQRCRRTLMGLAKIPVPGFSTGTLSATSAETNAFRGLRLIVPTDISPSGDLLQLEVGTEKQIVVSTAISGTAPGIPLRAFDQTGQDTGFIDMDWTPPGSGSPVRVTVSNKFAAPYTFEGALEGLQLV